MLLKAQIMYWVFLQPKYLVKDCQIFIDNNRFSHHEIVIGDKVENPTEALLFH